MTAWWIISICDRTSWHFSSKIFTRAGTQKVVYWFEQIMKSIKNVLHKQKVYVEEKYLYFKYEIMYIYNILQFDRLFGKILSHYANKFLLKPCKVIYGFLLKPRRALYFYLVDYRVISCYNQMRVWNTPGNKSRNFDNILCLPWG